MIILFLIMIIISPIFIAISLYNTVKIYRKIKYIDKYGILMSVTWFAVEITGNDIFKHVIIYIIKLINFIIKKD